jgi:hypothetical protein
MPAAGVPPAPHMNSGIFRKLLFVAGLVGLALAIF